MYFWPTERDMFFLFVAIYLAKFLREEVRRMTFSSSLEAFVEQSALQYFAVHLS